MKELVITTSPNTSKQTLEVIENGFRKMLGETKTVFLTDGDMIGGFTASCGGKLWDLSIRTRLRLMTEHIESGVKE